ncbi:MAG TPA: hypothetical protein DDX39_07195 [Bacteroidales bacterium]|nr:MAG: hypothetical protein A2W98_01975 [Bacteroidetes bacterium GWF2_33_38]OFY85233.1 MAG: hypothetical protein A2236_10340 [Bacteroidetes bacterium RIFOXYA2_FULL_33_7]HBF88415.1 hypothetical protein [Bacteroidales bacterium]
MSKIVLKYAFITILSFASFFSYSQSKSFIENKGQLPNNVLFKAEFSNGAIFFENNAFTYNLFNEEDVKHSHAHHSHEESEKKHVINCHAYKVEFLNAKTTSEIIQKNASSDYINYYKGNDKSKWASNVKMYEEILYQNIYDGVNIRVYTSTNSYKYDLVVEPNASTEKIKLFYNGVDDIKIKNGDLIIKTSIQDIIEKKPIAYQIIAEQKTNVECNYIISKDNVLTFELGDYDKSKQLIIDPELIFSTYTGSTVDNWGFTATFDYHGNVFSGGIVDDFGYPVSLGAYQTNHAGLWDVGIIKYTPDGTNRIYATYLGGSGCEMPHSLVVNEFNELLIFGTTGSSDFPTSSNAYDHTFNGGDALSYDNTIVFDNGIDIYVTRLSESGSALLGSTYVGGSENDGLNFKSYIDNSATTLMHGNDSLYYNYADGARGEIITDGKNNVYVGSCTFSSNFPITTDAFQNDYGGKQEGVVFKLSADLSTLIWSSFLGGSEDDAVYSVDTDDDFDVYVSGGTVSHDFPTSNGAYNETFNGGTTDGFVSYISSSGKILKGSTFFGSGEYDQAYFVKLDGENNPHIAGQTKADGATLIHNATYFVPNSGQFIAKLNPELTDLDWSTVFGTGNGRPNISITAFTVDVCNRIYLSGWGREWAGYFPFTLGSSYEEYWQSIDGTKDLPTTSDAFQTVTDGQDFYVMVISDDASSLDYATFIGEVHNSSVCYYGGRDHVDGGTSRFDKKGNIYQSVCASCGGCNSFPTSPNPGVWSPESGAAPYNNCNNAVFRFSFMEDFSVADFSLPPSGCAPYEIDFINNSMGANFFWDFGDGTTSTIEQPSHTYNESGIFNITLIASDPTSCNLADTITKQIQVLDNEVDTLDLIEICPNQSIQIGVETSSDPSVHYSWFPATGLSETDISNPIATPTVSTTYLLEISNVNCVDTVFQEIEIKQNTINVTAENDNDICLGEAADLSAFSNQSETNFTWATDASFNNIINPSVNDSTITVNPTLSQLYFVMGETNYCNYFDVDTVFVEVHKNEIQSSNDVYVCLGDSIQLNVQSLISGDTLSYSWQPSSSIIGSSTVSNPWVKPTEDTEYTVNTINQFSCEDTDIVLVQVDEVTATSDYSDATCFGLCDGEISVTPSGIFPFTYSWSNSSSSANINSLCDGNYFLTIIDDIGCEREMSFTISEPDELIISMIDTLILNCDGTCNGTVFPVISGGTVPYNYSWSNSTNQSNLSGLCIGNYKLTVADANNCKDYDTLIVVDPSDLELALEITKPLKCFGDCDGIIVATASLGVSPYNYSWNISSKSNINENLCSGIYYVTVIDGDGCIRIAGELLSQPQKLEGSISHQDIICKGDTTVVVANVDGGTLPYSYLWSNFETSSSISGVNAGEFSVSVVDANNCKDSVTAIITEPEKLLLDSLVKNIACFGVCDGEIRLSIVGGVQPYSFNWNNSSQDSLNVDLCEGEYNVTVTDYKGCKILQGFTVYNQNYIPPLEAYVDDSMLFVGQTTQMFATADDNYIYFWEPIESLNNSTLSNPLATPVTTTSYVVTILDEKGCENKDTVIIYVDDFACEEPYVFVPNAFTPDEDGNNDILYVYGNVIKDFYFAVYDRWGEKVFETSQLNVGWDGTYKGKEMDPAVYVYYLKATCINDEEYIKKGNVTLIR